MKIANINKWVNIFTKIVDKLDKTDDLAELMVYDSMLQRLKEYAESRIAKRKQIVADTEFDNTEALCLQRLFRLIGDNE